MTPSTPTPRSGEPAARSSTRLQERPGWALLLAAAADLHAAEVLAGDPVADPASAKPHLLQFWTRIHGAVRQAGLGDPGELATWMAGNLPGLSLARRRRCQAQWADLAGTTSTRAALRVHVRDARAVLSALEPMIGGSALLRRGRRITWGVLAIVLMLAPALAWQLATQEIPGAGPWRGSYYPDRELESDPIHRRDLDVDFDWTTRGPMDEIPPDKFSVRWDTCLELSETTEVVFQFRANDGSRFYVDGELVIDSWERDAKTKVKGFGAAELELEAGIHHLRAEMFESLGTSSATLVASLDGRAPKPIPHQVLHYPGDEFDEEDPCAAVR